MYILTTSLLIIITIIYAISWLWAGSNIIHMWAYFRGKGDGIVLTSASVIIVLIVAPFIVFPEMIKSAKHYLNPRE